MICRFNLDKVTEIDGYVFEFRRAKTTVLKLKYLNLISSNLIATLKQAIVISLEPIEDESLKNYIIKKRISYFLESLKLSIETWNPFEPGALTFESYVLGDLSDLMPRRLDIEMKDKLREEKLNVHN